MIESEHYEALQEYNDFQRLIYTKEYLTKEQYDFCVGYDKDVKNHLSYGGYSEEMSYINFNVYSEHDHEKS